MKQFVYLSERLDTAEDIESYVPGVYMLFRNGELIYVGSTDDLRFRLQQHRRGNAWNQHPYDYALIVRTPKYRLKARERSLIHANRPYLNRQFNRPRPGAPNDH